MIWGKETNKKEKTKGNKLMEKEKRNDTKGNKSTKKRKYHETGQDSGILGKNKRQEFKEM